MLIVTRGFGVVLANEPCRHWRFVMPTSPGAQMSGTASGSRSEPHAATIALMSIRPITCEPGSTHSPFAASHP